MPDLRVHLKPAPYGIMVGRGTLSRCGRILARMAAGRQVVVITAPPIRRHYGRPVVTSLKAAGLTPIVLTVRDGEGVKSLRWASWLYDRLIEAKCDRDATLIALGGGVIGDLTGFVASTYLRGVHCVQLPTTLVAQVDAAIGGKTAVNHPKGKNLIGSFYQPALVLADVATLRTLPRRDLIGGLAEVVKYGVIADRMLFGYLEAHGRELLARRPDALEQIVRRSAAIKAKIVSRDEREAGLRRVLNYGHTLGHAIETVSGYRRFHHGEAIAIGMDFAAHLSARLGICGQPLVERQRRLLTQLGLPTGLPDRLEHRRLLATMALDKKVRGGRLHFVLPLRLGAVRVVPVEMAAVRATLRALSSHR